MNRNQQCTSNDALNYLLEDLFMGHELIPDVLDKPPLYPLELTYKTIRTYPGMKLTADLTRFKPMLHWPANRNSIYTVVMSNLDINNRKNRYVHKYKYIIKKIMQTNIFGWGPGNHVISHLEITKITEIFLIWANVSMSAKGQFLQDKCQTSILRTFMY